MADPVKTIFNDVNSAPLNGAPVQGMKKVRSKGRPSVEDYLEPEATEEIAVSSEKIMENYPFFGTLLKKEKGIFRRKEVIPRSQPQTIEEVEQMYGGGSFQVRLKREDGLEEKINFSIADSSTPTDQAQPSQKIDQQFIQTMRRDIRDEVKQEYQEIIQVLEQRLKVKDGELDDMTSKVRRLTMEVSEIERQSNSMVRNETSEYQDKIDRLKEEIQDLKFENYGLEQELKYSGVDEGFNFKEILQNAMNNPELYKVITPFLSKLQSQDQASATPALSGPNQANPQPQPQQNDLPDQSGEQRNNPETETENPQKKMQYIVNTFLNNVVQSVSSAMIHGKPGPEGITNTINQGLRTLESNGMKAEPGLWIQISKKLIDVALANSISAERAAETISPILEQLNGAADQLRYVTPAMAAEFIINKFGVDVTENQKAFLVEILKAFKDQLKTKA